MTKFITSSVVFNKALNYKFHHLRLKTEDLEFKFKTGQFVVIKVEPLIFRSYSIASSPAELPFWDLFVDVTPQGPGTKYLEKLKPGQEIETMPPVGNFVLGPNPAANIVLAATGCGIASVKPLTKQLLQQYPESQIKLFWGLRHIKDIVWQDEFNSWQKEYPQFYFHLCLSKPESEWQGATGHVTHYLLETARSLPVNKSEFYLCGNANMIEDITVGLRKINIPSDKIFFEKY